VSNTSRMRARLFLFAIGVVVVATLVVAAVLGNWRVKSPRIGPDVEAICVETMLRSGPDRTWVASSPVRGGGEIRSVTLGELRGHDRQLVRVAGVLHAEFEHVALYASRAAMDDDLYGAPWVSLQRLAVGEDQRTMRTAVSDRCVVVEATYERRQLGDVEMFNGTLDAVKLEVWSTPHRPLPRPSPPPPPPPPSRTTSPPEPHQGNDRR
jgi:hypothetical protein